MSERFMVVGRFFYAALNAEIEAGHWRDRGANWRRVKRERRKALKRWLSTPP